MRYICCHARFDATDHQLFVVGNPSAGWLECRCGQMRGRLSFFVLLALLLLAFFFADTVVVESDRIKRGIEPLFVIGDTGALSFFLVLKTRLSPVNTLSLTCQCTRPTTISLQEGTRTYEAHLDVRIRFKCRFQGVISVQCIFLL